MGHGWKDAGVGQEGWKTGGMQSWKDAGQEGRRTGELQGWRDAGQEDAGQEGWKTGGTWLEGCRCRTEVCKTGGMQG